MINMYFAPKLSAAIKAGIDLELHSENFPVKRQIRAFRCRKFQLIKNTNQGIIIIYAFEKLSP